MNVTFGKTSKYSTVSQTQKYLLASNINPIAIAIKLQPLSRCNYDHTQFSSTSQTLLFLQSYNVSVSNTSVIARPCNGRSNPFLATFLDCRVATKVAPRNDICAYNSSLRDHAMVEAIHF